MICLYYITEDGKAVFVNNPLKIEIYDKPMVILKGEK